MNKFYFPSIVRTLFRVDIFHPARLSPIRSPGLRTRHNETLAWHLNPECTQSLLGAPKAYADLPRSRLPYGTNAANPVGDLAMSKGDFEVPMAECMARGVSKEVHRFASKRKSKWKVTLRRGAAHGRTRVCARPGAMHRRGPRPSHRIATLSIRCQRRKR